MTLQPCFQPASPQLPTPLQEKYKMAALIKQANKRVRNGQEAKDEKERTHGERERELSEKEEEASNVSEQRDKGWIHVIRVHETTHLAVTTTRQGNYPTKRKNERSR